MVDGGSGLRWVTVVVGCDGCLWVVDDGGSGLWMMVAVGC